MEPIMENQTATVIQNIADACAQGAVSNLLVPLPLIPLAAAKGCIEGAVVQGLIETARPSVAQ